MSKEELKQGIFDVIIRKNLMDLTQTVELLELLGEDKFYELIFQLSGQTLKVPSADTILREYRNQFIGRTLDECDNRFVRKELKQRWDLTSANLSQIYRKYKHDVETAEYSAEMKSDEHLIEKIKKRRKKGEISFKSAQRDISTFGGFIAQHRQDLNYCLKLIAINYPESLDSDRDDIFAKALRRVKKQVRDSEAAKVRRRIRNEERFFKEK